MSGRFPARALRLALAAALMAACSAQPSSTPGTPATPVSPASLPALNPFPLASGAYRDAPPCTFPDRVQMPAWVPRSLPLPQGTYAQSDLPKANGYDRAVLVVPGPLDALARFILDRWPPAGWVLGRSESEIGEIEAQFSRPPSVGAIKAQAVLCNPGFALMLLIYATDVAQLPAIGPGAQPSLSPSPGPVP